MRRTTTRLSLWVLAAVSLLAIQAQGQSEAGTVAAVVGTLEIQRGGSWQNASVGVPVFVGDRLRTGQKGQAKIVFADDSVLDMAPNTEVLLDKQTVDPAARRFESLLRLFKGKVRAWVSEYYQEPHARYEIETPTAIAGVRGTEFIALYDSAAEFTDVVGVQGTVELVGRLAVLGGAVQVGPQLFSRVEKGRFPTTPQHLDDAEFRRYLSGLDIVGTGKRDGLNVQHPATNGQLLFTHDVPSVQGSQRGVPAGLRVKAPSGSVADQLSPDVATNTQPLLEYRSTPPGSVPTGTVKVGF